MIEYCFDVSIWVPGLRNVDEVAFEVSCPDSSIHGDHVRLACGWGYIGELQKMVSQDGNVLARNGLQ